MSCCAESIPLHSKSSDPVPLPLSIPKITIKPPPPPPASIHPPLKKKSLANSPAPIVHGMNPTWIYFTDHCTTTRIKHILVIKVKYLPPAYASFYFFHPTVQRR